MQLDGGHLPVLGWRCLAGWSGGYSGIMAGVLVDGLFCQGVKSNVLWTVRVRMDGGGSVEYQVGRY